MQLIENASKKEVLMMSFEEKMKKELKKNLEIPDVVEQKIQDAYKEIGQGNVTMKKLSNGNQKKKRAWTAAAAAVAVIAVSGSVFYANPVLAKNIPVIGDVFAKLQKNKENTPYGEKDKTAYGKIADNSESVQNPGSEAENNGVTVTVSDAYCDGYEMYFTITAITDNDQVNQKDYLLPEKIQQVYVNGEETGAELSLEKTEDGSFVGLGHISAGWLADKTFKDQSTVDIKFTELYAKVENQPEPATYVEGENLITGQWNLEFTVGTDTNPLNTYEVNTANNGFTVSKIVKAPASTYLYLEVPEEYENVQMILTDADGNKLEKFGGTTTDPENGMYEIQLQFEQTDTNQIHVQVIDMDQSTNDNLAMVAEMTADLN